MRLTRSNVTIAFLALAGGVLELLADPANAKPAFVFRNTGYFHRWSQNHQHEFTPDKQEDLEKWADMITVNGYPEVHDADRLAQTANAVLENYKKVPGKVLKTNSVPRTANQPAEHFIAVSFTRPAFIEVAFARFKLLDGIGGSFVYSHRFYGEKMAEQASAWLDANGAAIEKALMEWTAMPSPASLRLEHTAAVE